MGAVWDDNASSIAVTVSISEDELTVIIASQLVRLVLLRQQRIYTFYPCPVYDAIWIAAPDGES
jgi:hypothetical protein